MILLEIGRLRELTFRQVGEGSGLARDLDRFDASYSILSFGIMGPNRFWEPTVWDLDQTWLKQPDSAVFI